jgi:hypothetical protein
LSSDDISFPSALDGSLATESTSVIPTTAITFSLESNPAGNSPDTPTQKALHPEDDSGAETDLDSFNAILKAQATPTLPGDLGGDLTSLLKDMNSGNTSAAKADLSKVQAQAAPTLPGDLGSDLASLLKDMTTGNTSAAKADVSKVQTDLQTQDASSVAGAQTGGPLDSLIGKISESLNSDSVQGAPQDGARRDHSQLPGGERTGRGQSRQHLCIEKLGEQSFWRVGCAHAPSVDSGFGARNYAREARANRVLTRLGPMCP